MISLRLALISYFITHGCISYASSDQCSQNRDLYSDEENYSMGLCYIQQNKISEAILAFERVLILNPNHVGAWLDLQSIQGYSTVVHVDPYSKSIYDRLLNNTSYYFSAGIGYTDNYNDGISKNTTKIFFLGRHLDVSISEDYTQKSSFFLEPKIGAQYTDENNYFRYYLIGETSLKIPKNKALDLHNSFIAGGGIQDSIYFDYDIAYLHSSVENGNSIKKGDFAVVNLSKNGIFIEYINGREKNDNKVYHSDEVRIGYKDHMLFLGKNYQYNVSAILGNSHSESGKSSSNGLTADLTHNTNHGVEYKLSYSYKTTKDHYLYNELLLPEVYRSLHSQNITASIAKNIRSSNIKLYLSKDHHRSNIDFLNKEKNTLGIEWLFIF